MISISGGFLETFQLFLSLFCVVRIDNKPTAKFLTRGFENNETPIFYDYIQGRFVSHIFFLLFSQHVCSKLDSKTKKKLFFSPDF